MEGGDSDLKMPNKGPSHGDELAYIFEPLDAEGKSLRQEISSTDNRVRDSFVGLISKFAHNVGPSLKNNSQLFGFQPFSQDNEQFLKISYKITTDKNFRFCQMGLWGNIADRLTGAFCKNFLGGVLSLPKATLPVALPVPLTDEFNVLSPAQWGQNKPGTSPKPLWNNPLPFRF